MLFQTIRKRSGLFYLLIVVLSITNSVMFGAVFLFINMLITQDPLVQSQPYSWVAFGVLLAVSLVCRRLFQTRMAKLTNDILFDFEVSVLHQLRSASFEAFEKMGAHRIHTVIGDTRTLGQLPGLLVNTINSVVVILFSLAYLFWISPWGAVVVTGVVAALLVFYILRNNSLEKDLNQVRDLQDAYYRYLQDLLLGFKEMKMSKTRNKNMYDKYLVQNRLAGKTIETNTTIRYMDNGLIGSYGWYVIIGITLFGLPRLVSLDLAAVSVIILTILYLKGPVDWLIYILPYSTKLKIALNRIADFEKEVHVTSDATEAIHSPGMPDAGVGNIRLDQVRYEYQDKELARNFVLGPVNLEIKKGEILFVTGGNGSGKSTFINVLTGLYKPQSGFLLMNDYPLHARDFSHYSNFISAIFSNNHLFTENYDGFDLEQMNGKLAEYIEMMHLSRIVQRKGSNGISTKLSKGQQKRLAMIYALMEDRPVFVLDEWAAEQDPFFRRYFYETLLPQLKRAGKTVIAVTHDDQYFACADRVIKFDYGQVVEDTRNIPAALSVSGAE